MIGDRSIIHTATLDGLNIPRISTALTRRPRDQATGSSTVGELLVAHPIAEETGSELLVETRREIMRWAAEQIRPEFTEQTWDVFWKNLQGTTFSQ